MRQVLASPAPPGCCNLAYWTSPLLAEHGPEIPMPALLRIIAADCPRLNADRIYETCGVHCPQMSHYFYQANGEGTVRLAACRDGLGRVAGRDDNACLAQLRRPPVPGRDH